MKLFLRTSNNDCVYIDVSILYNRYLISLIIFHLIEGNRVVLKYHSNFILYWDKYFQKLANFKNFELTLLAPKQKRLAISDSNNKQSNIEVRPHYFNEDSSGTFHFPFTLHPNMYFTGVSNIPPSFKNKSAFLIGFAGNLDALAYQDISFKGEIYFSRNNLLRQIEENFPDLLFKPRSYFELIKATNDGSYSEKICIIDRDIFSLNNQEYIEFISACKFSICPPGVKMVYCHNLIESMFVGCVPILQYASLMKPKLHNNFNCLSFNNEPEFLQRIREIINDEVNYESISKNVSQYYSQHLAPSAVIAKIENLSKIENAKINLLCGNAGEISVNLANH